MESEIKKSEIGCALKKYLKDKSIKNVIVKNEKE